MMRLFSATLIIGMGALTSAAAAQAPCEGICKASLDEEVVYAAPINRQSPDRIAELTVVGGQVLQTAATEMTPIETQAGLSIGDQVMLIEDSQATLAGSAGQAQLTGPAMLNVVAADSCGCVTRNALQTFAQFEGDGDDQGMLFAAGAVITFGVVGGIIMALDDDDDVPVSP